MRKITRIRRTSPFFVWKQKNKTDITVKEKYAPEDSDMVLRGIFFMLFITFPN